SGVMTVLWRCSWRPLCGSLIAVPGTIEVLQPLQRTNQLRLDLIATLVVGLDDLGHVGGKRETCQCIERLVETSPNLRFHARSFGALGIGSGVAFPRPIVGRPSPTDGFGDWIEGEPPLCHGGDLLGRAFVEHRAGVLNAGLADDQHLGRSRTPNSVFY